MLSVSPRDLMKSYYDSFSKKDHEGICKLYHPSAQFEDPVFGNLNATETQSMWTMLLTRASNLQISYKILRETKEQAEGEMIAEYEFGKKKRKVLNHIKTTMTVSDGKIIRQVDRFNFWRWCTMAFGTFGFAIGWIPFFANKIKKTARQSLKLYIEKNNS